MHQVAFICGKHALIANFEFRTNYGGLYTDTAITIMINDTKFHLWNGYEHDNINLCNWSYLEYICSCM